MFALWFRYVRHSATGETQSSVRTAIFSFRTDLFVQKRVLLRNWKYRD